MLPIAPLRSGYAVGVKFDDVNMLCDPIVELEAIFIIPSNS
jgi:hypothetical protein